MVDSLTVEFIPEEVLERDFMLAVAYIDGGVRAAVERDYVSPAFEIDQVFEFGRDPAVELEIEPCVADPSNRISPRYANSALSALKLVVFCARLRTQARWGEAVPEDRSTTFRLRLPITSVQLE